MVLLRLRDEDGLVGLGEAVPLGAARRRGARGGRRGARGPGPGLGARRRGRGGQRRRGGRACRRARALGAGPLRGADRAARPRRAPGRRRLAAAEPVPCNATLVAGRAGRGRRGRAALAGRGLRDLQAEARRRRRRRPGAGRARGARARGADPRRRQRGLGPGDGEAVLAEIEPLGDPARRAAGGDDGAGGRAGARRPSIPLAGDESVETPGGRAAGGRGPAPSG